MATIRRLPPKLRLVGDPSPSSKAAHPLGFAHKNRHGVTYYLHEGRSKTGKPRYFFAKVAGAGVISAMPAGYEVSESINGVVSVKRIDPTAARVPESDVQLVKVAIGRLPKLKEFAVEAKGEEIFIYEPDDGERREGLADLARSMGISPEAAARIYDRIKRPTRFRPVMKFAPAFPVGAPEVYLAFRMTYRGKGGWMALTTGTLDELLKRYLPHLGRESFFVM